MIKLRIDSTTGRVLGAYPEEFEVPEPYIEISEEESSAMSADSENIYFYLDEELQPFSRTEIETKEKRKAEIEEELETLDAKRIRAVCEPSIKDESTGETWLDYYNSEIVALREELSSL